MVWASTDWNDLDSEAKRSRVADVLEDRESRYDPVVFS